MNESVFNYQISLQNNIIHIEFWGKYAEQSIVEATVAVLQFAHQTKTRNVLYDASRLQGAVGNLQKNIFHLNKITNSNSLEKLAIYTPNYWQNRASRLVDLFVNSKKERIFSNKEKAMEWLKS